MNTHRKRHDSNNMNHTDHHITRTTKTKTKKSTSNKHNITISHNMTHWFQLPAIATGARHCSRKIHSGRVRKWNDYDTSSRVLCTVIIRVRDDETGRRNRLFRCVNLLAGKLSFDKSLWGNLRIFGVKSCTKMALLLYRKFDGCIWFFF